MILLEKLAKLQQAAKACCRRMLASTLCMHAVILFLSFVVVLIVVQTLK